MSGLIPVLGKKFTAAMTPGGDPGWGEKFAEFLTSATDQKKEPLLRREIWVFGALVVLGSTLHGKFKELPWPEKVAYAVISTLSAVVWLAGALVVAVIKAIIKFISNPKESSKNLGAYSVVALKVLAVVAIIGGLGYATYAIIL